MYFTAEQYRDYVNSPAIQNDRWNAAPPRITLPQARKVLRLAKAALIRRDYGFGHGWGRDRVDGFIGELGKWLRPWDVIPALKNFKAPRGDFGIGIEVEHGFNSEATASDVVRHALRWKHVATDAEGGENGVEVTFPPMSYATFKKGKSNAQKYVKMLEDGAIDLYEHDPEELVGIHVNVSGGLYAPRVNEGRVDELNELIEPLQYFNNDVTEYHDKCMKYFGRHPYGSANYNGWGSGTSFIEFKLFDSDRSVLNLKRYVAIAVELYQLVQEGNNEPITYDSMWAACERGYVSVT